jgi:hypothetical protein
MTTKRTIFKSPIADQQTVFGPSTHVNVGSLIDLCQHAKPVLNASFSTIWKSGKFCEIVFCQNSTISFNETDLDFSVFSVLFDFLKISIVTFVKNQFMKSCSIFQFNRRFIEKVKNKTCKSSNEMLGKFSKCGNFMEYSDVFPYFQDWCYSISRNRFFFKNDFVNLFLTPFSYFAPAAYTSTVNVVLLIFSMFFVIIPEVISDLVTIKKRNYLYLWRFIFSIRHQIIILLIISLFPHLITVLFYSFLGIVYDFSSMFSFLAISLAFFQLVVLWLGFVIFHLQGSHLFSIYNFKFNDFKEINV